MGEAAILTRCETTVCARLTQGRLFDLWSKASLVSDCASSEFGKKQRFFAQNPCHTLPHAVEFPIRYPSERHAGRILGMGDIVALVEQVTAGVDIQAAQKLAAKVKSGGGFDLNDFLAQIQQMKQMGGLSSLMDKLPSQLSAKAGQVDMDKAEKDIKRKEGIIQSMTPLERRKPELIKATR